MGPINLFDILLKWLREKYGDIFMADGGNSYADFIFLRPDLTHNREVGYYFVSILVYKQPVKVNVRNVFSDEVTTLDPIDPEFFDKLEAAASKIMQLYAIKGC